MPGYGFQCSSASRKFLNRARVRSRALCCRSFSALQRAENSSISIAIASLSAPKGFSALQRAENSSIFAITTAAPSSTVSVLFSEPKIPQSVRVDGRIRRRRRFSALQRAENSSMRRTLRARFSSSKVSVLFSEPKIPQSSACG